MLAPTSAADLKAQKTPSTIAIYFSMVVWGDSFVRLFLEFCLPTLLAPGNIPHIRHRVGSKFILHTRPADLPSIEESPAFRLLKQTIEVDVRLIVSDDTPHELLSLCHRETMSLADAAEVPVVFLSPDTLWSNGSIASVDRLLASGKRVIFLSSFRLTKEDAEPHLRELCGRRETVALPIEARELNRLAFQFLHPLIEEYFFEPGRGNALLPMLLLWQLPNGDVLAHGFHQHPLLVYPTKRFANFVQTIDGDLVRSACPDRRFHHIVQDSDEITAIEFSKRDHMIPGFLPKGDVNGVAEWAMVGANPVHWRLFPTQIRMHAHEIDPALWQPVEARAGEVVRSILGYRRRRFLRVAFEDALFFCMRPFTGISRPAFNEWIFRRRHFISFHVRDWMLRVRHRVAFAYRMMFHVVLPRVGGALVDRAHRWRWKLKHFAWHARHRASFLVRNVVHRLVHRLVFLVRNARFLGVHRIRFLVRSIAQRLL